MKQILNVGKITTSVGQVKKHYSQMSKEEIAYLMEQLHNTGRLTKSHHVMEKERLGITKFEGLYKSFDIIEYNEFHGDKRVLIRFKDRVLVDFGGVEEYGNLCAVISILNSRLVTVYWNKCSDNHRTLNLNMYDNSLKIIKE